MALQPVDEKIAEKVPDLMMNVWYLDDGTLCGSKEDLLAALRINEEDGPARGLHLNRSKSLLFVPPNADVSDNPLPADIPISREGFVLLGTPVGSPSFCSSYVSKQALKILNSLNLLPDLEDSQMEYVLLCSCLSFPKFSFILRTCPPSLTEGAIQQFDNALCDAVSGIVGAPLSKWAWQKASFPIFNGGLCL